MEGKFLLCIISVIGIAVSWFAIHSAARLKRQRPGVKATSRTSLSRSQQHKPRPSRSLLAVQ